jgi:hypothetical protein
LTLDRPGLVREARRLRLVALPEAEGLATGTCLLDALAFSEVARRVGLRAILQAGSASWRRVPKEEDDGIEPTFFSFMWEPDSLLTRAAIAAEVLPEIHVWVGVEVDGTWEVVDLTTGRLPELCRNLARLPWRSPAPPDYLWASRAPDGFDVRYVPLEDATIFAYRSGLPIAALLRDAR